MKFTAKKTETARFTPVQIVERARRWKSTAKNFTETPLKYPRVEIDTTDDINAETLYNKAISITTKAIFTNFARSGNEKMRKLYFSCVAFANGFKDDGEGGADLIQDTALYLWQYDGRKLTEYTTDGQKNKDGNPITILRGAFRNVAKLIQRQAREDFRRIYIEDYETEHGQIAVPFGWDIDDFETLTAIDEIINSMGLTDTQAQILGFRMRGMSIRECMTAKGSKSINGMYKIMEQIRKKYVDLYGVPSSVKLAKVTQ